MLCWLRFCGLRRAKFSGAADGFDCIDGNERWREQLAGADDILGTFAAGQQAIVADAVEACGQHVHQETADELVGGERHDLVALGTFDPVVLPFESDAFVIACDQAAVRDGDAVGVAREIAQDFLRAAEWALAIDHPFAFAQGAR